MRVHCLVRERVITVDCGDGYQRVKWLAMIATQRYDDLLTVTDGGYGGVGKKHVPCGLEDEKGRRIPPTKTVNRLPAAIAAADGVDLQPGYEPRVRVLLLDDAPTTHKNGTSPFLTAIAAVPDMCLVTGSGLVSCAPLHHATFAVYCRDNFSIPISNGGEDLSVTFTNDSGVVLRADVNDHADGPPRDCFACCPSGVRACAHRACPVHPAPPCCAIPLRAPLLQAPTPWCTSCPSAARTQWTSPSTATT